MDCGLLCLFNKWTVSICVIGYVIYKWATKTFQFFEERGVPYQKPAPFFGNFLNIALQKTSIGENLIDLYNQFKTKR